MHFTFGTPLFLLLLLLTPCFFWCREYTKTFYFSRTEWIGQESALLSREPWLRVLVFSLMVFALARPFIYESEGNTQKKGRDLVLALDASGSMAQSGFNPKARFKSKYDTTIDLAKAFIQKRFDDNMGIVVFGTFAYTASPLTYDLEALSFLLEMTNVGIAGESTAIGDAIMQALHTLSFGEAKHKAVILITDGHHNAGRTSPKEAVTEAKKEGVRVYTIGIGNKRDYDAALLETIAKETGAKSYAAGDEEALQTVFADIAALEPSPIRGENYLGQKLLIALPLIPAMTLLLWWLWREQEEPSSFTSKGMR
ncbi:MAG: VWA domain-containing protein [Sulfurovum sp.]|nr:VWA domain-containing protein [Sulfurovum sp.]